MATADLVVPSLSQIEAYDFTHLYEAADYRTAVAEAWEHAFTQARGQVAAAGWEGQAHDAALDRADNDAMQVRGPVWPLRDAAEIARSGADDQYAAKQRTLSSVDDARVAGFEVREDLAVNAYVSGRPLTQAMAMQPRANELTAEIRAHAADLAELDHKAAAELTAATAGLHDFAFPPEAPNNDGVIRAVDLKQDGGTPPGAPQLPSEPAPPGKEWHFYSTWGWVLEEPLEHRTGEEEFWTLAQIAGGLSAAVFGGPIGIITGIPAAGAGINDIIHSAPPGS